MERIGDGAQPLGSEKYWSEGGVLHGADSPFQTANLPKPDQVDPFCGARTKLY